MWLRSPVEWGDIISHGGQDGQIRHYTATPADYKRWVDIFAKSTIAEQVLHGTESAQEFFRIESDLAKLIPPREHNEAFYSMKLGYCIPDVPAQFVYFAKKVYDKYRVCNLVCPLLPKDVSSCAARASYFSSGYSMLDVLRTFVNEDFTPVTSEAYVVRCGGWYEIWLPLCEMIAAVPASIGAKLHNEDAERIIMTTHGLMLDNVPLTALVGGSIGGVIGSGFDLR